MGKHMKKIILCPNPTRDVGLAHTETIRMRLQDVGVQADVYPLYSINEEPCEVDKMAHRGRRVLQEAICDADLLICLGGDGTILHLARAAAPYRIPIVTVNLGRKGFIAELAPDDAEKIVEIAVSDCYNIQERMMLDVCVLRSGVSVYEGFALNDAVVRGVTRLIDLDVFGDGQLITQFSGDGIIISTPTGSTAYLMSAGGAIIEPTAKNLAITPICAHALIAKSFVLAPERTVLVKISLSGEKHAYLSVDGGSFDLEDLDEISVTQSRYVTRLIKCEERSFYQILSEKLY